MVDSSIPIMAFVIDKHTREVKQRKYHKVIEEEEILRKEKEQIQAGKVWTREERGELSRKSGAS